MGFPRCPLLMLASRSPSTLASWFLCWRAQTLVQRKFERYWDTAAAVGFFHRRRNWEIPEELYYDHYISWLRASASESGSIP